MNKRPCGKIGRRKQMDLQTYLHEKMNFINKTLDNLLPGEDTYPYSIHRAMRYSVFAGGKRLRPILTMASAEACGGNAEAVKEVACALEMIHTYTLIHDDLPAMDNDDYRRGKLTCHKAFNEAIAILAGDALLTYAFEILAQNGLKNKVGMEIIDIIAKAIGSKGLIGGQVVDFESGGKNPDECTLNYIHENKTAALFRADEEKMTNLDLYSKYLGLAFQITDDILDIEGEIEKIGKDVGSDEKNFKLTYPSMYGLEKSKCMADENLDKAIECINIFGNKAEILKELVIFVVNREY
jgi:geranylgeranyl diphosphate synthase type II